MSQNTPPSTSDCNPWPMAGARKMPIPRLQHTSPAQNPKGRRVAQACTACRSRKIKCSGDAPPCKHCEETGRECVYIMPRKDRLKIVTERCVQMAGALNELRNCTSDDNKAKIDELLDAIEKDISGIRQPQMPPNPNSPTKESFEGFRPLDLCNDSLDLIDEDLLKDERARATGFVGMNSEVQWLRTIVSQLERSEEGPAQPTTEQRRLYAQGGTDRVSSFSFYTDHESVDPDFCVSLHELPAPDMAQRLLDCYMATVHESFPILPRKPFEDQFQRYFEAVKSGNAPRLSPRWQAILNLVFAIGAKYSHLSQASWRGDERDHVVYQARARKFGLSESALTDHSDVPQIQVAGLLAFYYLSIGQISRAWMMVGTALRFAYSLGLHIRNEDPSATIAKREMLVRIWWSLYTLERLLSVATGRPSIIVDSSCSVPMPVPLSEEQITEDAETAHWCRRSSTPSTVSSSATSTSFPGIFPKANSHHMSRTLWEDEPNSGTYFRAAIQISIITQDVLSSLYTASTMVRSPAEIQQNMVQLGQRVDQWLSSLPHEFNFQTRRPEIATGPQKYLRERLCLGFRFCSARILITRPCLGVFNSATNESAGASMSVAFIRKMAAICIESAKTVVDFLPDSPNPLFIYKHGPWWSVVHNLMQAFSIFVLELSHSTPVHQDNTILLRYSKQAIRSLRVMQDPLARRAYQMALRTLEAVASRVSLDISDLWVEHAMALPQSEVYINSAAPENVGAFSRDHESKLDMEMLAPTLVPSLFSPLQAEGLYFDNGLQRRGGVQQHQDGVEPK